MRNKGFTLIEMLVVLGIIGILAAVVLVAVNPGRQFAQARDTQRRSDLYAISSAVYQYAAENDGVLPASVPDTATCIGTDVACTDMSGDLVPTYIADMPMDPSTGTAANTQYTIVKEATGRITLTATGEIAGSIVVTK